MKNWMNFIIVSSTEMLNLVSKKRKESSFLSTGRNQYLPTATPSPSTLPFFRPVAKSSRCEKGAPGGQNQGPWKNRITTSSRNDLFFDASLCRNDLFFEKVALISSKRLTLALLGEGQPRRKGLKNWSIQFY
jgi:hypothetical protein